MKLLAVYSMVKSKRVFIFRSSVGGALYLKKITLVSFVSENLFLLESLFVNNLLDC